MKSNEKAFDVVALGELLIDFTENGISGQGNPMLEANPGGAPCNVLAMLQNLGKKTAFIGKVGADAFGEYLSKTLVEIGIDTSNLMKDEKVPTTLAFVHTGENGDRSFSFYRNPGADLMLRELEVNLDLIADSRIFHFGTLSMTEEKVCAATKAAVEFAREKGIIISFDPNLRPLLWEDMERAKEMMIYGIEHCDVLKIADNEITFLTGKDSVEEAIDSFEKVYHPKLTCVTLGREGSVILYGGKRFKMEAVLREDTVETTGAGDTYMGCVLNSLLEYGLEHLDSLSDEEIQKLQRFASIAASIITTRKGALKVMPKREEIII